MRTVISIVLLKYFSEYGYHRSSTWFAVEKRFAPCKMTGENMICAQIAEKTLLSDTNIVRGITKKLSRNRTAAVWEEAEVVEQA